MPVLSARKVLESLKSGLASKGTVVEETRLECDPAGDETTLHEMLGMVVGKPEQLLSSSVTVAAIESGELAFSGEVVTENEVKAGGLAPQGDEVTGRNWVVAELPTWSRTVSANCQIPLGTSATKVGAAAVCDESWAVLPAGAEIIAQS